MPEITVTETQRERLAAIEGELDAAYIDTYGCIRTKDVVQYLLDTYTPPEQRGDPAHDRIATAEFQALQAVAAEVEGVPGSGIDTETMRGELLSTLGVETFAARLAAVDGAGSEKGGDVTENDDAESDVEDDAAAGTDTESGSGDDGAADSGEVSSATSSTETASAGDAADDETGADGSVETDGESGSTPGGDGPGAILSAANRLLDDHDDKWRDGGSDEPYEVDLPDGTTEKVRTKDDIRGLLFKHY